MVSVSLSYLYSRSINWWHLCFFWLKLYQNSISFTLGIKFEIAVELRDKKQIVLSFVLYGSQYFSWRYEPKASHYFLHYQLVYLDDLVGKGIRRKDYILLVRIGFCYEGILLLFWFKSLVLKDWFYITCNCFVWQLLFFLDDIVIKGVQFWLL